jgi:hypothetical protein
MARPGVCRVDDVTSVNDAAGRLNGVRVVWSAGGFALGSGGDGFDGRVCLDGQCIWEVVEETFPDGCDETVGP